MKPLWEKTRSMGADVAGIDKYFNASLYKHGYKCFLVKSKLGSRPSSHKQVSNSIKIFDLSSLATFLFSFR